MAISGTSTRWGGLRLEPYDPQARDADGDGIIQEGTAWERPDGTFLQDSAGSPIAAGANSATRLRGVRVVDAQGNKVDYTPSYETAGGAAGGTALSEHGAVSIGESGLPSIRDLVTPPERVPFGRPDALLAQREREGLNLEPLDPEVLDFLAVETPRAPEAETPEPEAESELTAMTPKQIRKKNASIKQKLIEAGAMMGRIDDEYKEARQKEADEGTESNLGVPVTRAEAIARRRKIQANSLFSVRRYLETGEFDANGQFALREVDRKSIDAMPDELKTLVLESSDQELNQMLLSQASRVQEEVKGGGVRVKMTWSKLAGFIRDGRYKTVFDRGTATDNAGVAGRTTTDARVIGIPPSAPVDVRPAAGYLITREVADLVDDGAGGEDQKLEKRLTGVSDIYGDITIDLKPEVLDRTAWSLGDSINHGGPGVVGMDEDDPEYIASVLINGSGQKNPTAVILNMLESERNGSTRGTTQSSQSGFGATEWRTGESTHDYLEANIAGSFDLDEVDSIRINSLDALEATPNVDEEVIDEYFSQEFLESVGFTESQIKFLLERKKQGSYELKDFVGFGSLYKLKSKQQAVELVKKLKNQHGVKLLMGDSGVEVTVESLEREVQEAINELDAYWDGLKQKVADEIQEELEDAVAQVIEAATGDPEAVVTKGLYEALQIKAPLNFRRRLIEEPYDPDARDGDGDGIVQEGTPWERPAGTRIMDASGTEIARGQISTFRSRSHRIVDTNGNAVDYVPSYERSDVGTIGRSVGVVRGPERDAEDSVAVDPNVNRPSRVPDYLRTAAKGKRGQARSGDGPIATSYTSRFMSVMSAARTAFLNIGRLRTFSSPNADNIAEEEDRADRISTALGIPSRFAGFSKLRDAAEIVFPVSPEPAVAERWQEASKQLFEEAEEFIQELHDERGVYVAVPFYALFGEDGNEEDVEQGVIFEPGIIRDERIKSQFETWTSQGLYNPEYRSEFELDHMNVPEDAADFERPIYGYIPSRMKDDGIEPDASGDRARVYTGGGGVFIRLRPEVSERTTVSLGDSLDHRLYPIPLDKELRDEHVRQLDAEGAALSGQELLIVGALGGAAEDILAARLVDRFIEENLSGNDSLSDIWNPGQIEAGLGRSLDYIETQIHGGVDLSDVEEIVLPVRLQFDGDNEGRPLAPDFLASANPHAKRLLAAARKHGFTVSWEDENRKKTVYYSATPQAPKAQASASSSTFTGSKPDPIPSASIEDMDMSPGTNADSMDRDELIAPVKPRAPYTPAPPPFSGRAAEIVDRAEGDFERVLELLDEEGYWLLDFETTGFDHGNMPTQVAMVRVQDGKVVQRINQFINPDRPLSEWSRQHLRDGDGNPLTEEWLAENGISVEDAQGRLSAVLNGQIVVAHNAPFDLEVLQRIVDENDGTLQLGGSVDTLALMRMAVPKGDGEETGPTSHALGSLASYLGYELGDGAHDAMADVDATNEVLRRGLLSAVDNERAEVGVLDNAYMADLYEKQKQEHAVSMAKHRDAMREYNKQVFEYRRALSESKDTEIPDVRVPYTPGPATGEAVIERAATSRAATKSLMMEKLIDLLADVGKGEEGDLEWERLSSAIRDALGREEVDVSDPRLRREWLAEKLTPLLERDDDFINELIDNALNEYADRELVKQIYVPATESTAATIIAEGRIQTHFETQPEGFTQSLRDRASVESELLGVPRDTADRGRPIYGFIPRTPDAGFAGNSQLDPDPTRDAATMHGPVLFRLKDDVRARTTATFGDSMTGSVGTAVPLTEAAREALLASFPDPTNGSRGDVRTGLLHAAVSDDFHEAAASIAARAWIDRLPEELRRGVLRRIRSEEAQAMIRPQNPRYVETQIHGGVALEDVAEIVLPNSTESLGEDIREVLRLARERSIPVVTADGRVPLETDVGWKFITPNASEQTDTKAFVGPRIEAKAASRRAALIDEPYDPDARDGDGDGIVQEWTVWERPAGTKLYIDGKPVTRGQRIQSTSITARPNNLVIRDAAGNEVNYVPTYMPKPEEGTIGADLGRLTPEPAEQGEVPKPVGSEVDAAKPKKRGSPLSDVGTPSLQELGASSVRQTARPAAAPLAPVPEGQTPQVPSGVDARRDRPIPDRKSIRRRYMPGVSGLYSVQTDDMQNRMRQYMATQVEGVRGLFLSKLIETFLDQLSETMALDSPRAADELVDMFGPIIVSPEAFREELSRITRPGRNSIMMHGQTYDLLEKMFSEHFDADIADAIVEAYRDEIELLTSGPIRIAIGSEALLLVLEEGRVKSQFETGYSQGSFAPEFRQNIENRIMGIPQNLPETLRPIYGFFADQQRDFGWNEDDELVVTPLTDVPPNQSSRPYGDHQIILRGEIRDRTTATIGDSFGSRGAVVPLDETVLEEIGAVLGYFTEDNEIDLDRVKNIVYMLSFSGAPSHQTISILAMEGLMRRQSPRKEAMLRKLILDSGVFRVGSIGDSNWMGYQYTEAQIHGGVDIEDIEKVILPYADISEVPLALVKLLEDRNIPFSLSPRGFDQ